MTQPPKFPNREDFASDDAWEAALEQYEDDVDEYLANLEKIQAPAVDMARFDADFGRVFGG